jgi:serine/threonine-protein kinase
VLDVGESDEGVPFLVMERLFGDSLRVSVARAGRLGILEAVSVGIQLLCALDAVHAAGIVHRDVKPDNVVLVARGGCDPLVKLFDFGLCRRTAFRHSGEETMTCEGALVGTPEYMAPEQVLGSASLDIRVDVYAVGVVLYEALTGDRAFFSRNLREILSGVMNKRIPPLRHVRPEAPASLDAAIRRAMEREPGRRYRSAAAFQAKLIEIRAELGGGPREEPATLPNSSDAGEVPTMELDRRSRRHPTRTPVPPQAPVRRAL